MENRKLKIVLGTSLVLVIAVIFNFSSGPNYEGNPILGIDDDEILGNVSAIVTIIEFSDYECPYCGAFFSGAYQEIKKKYVDTGKVRIVFRDFPLSIHPDSQKAAEAAQCAGEQGKYYEMHDKLFLNQYALDISSLKQYAQEIDLNLDKFNFCLDTDKMRDEVKSDFNDGRAIGVTGTPAFFINGEKITGAQPFSVFEEIIESKLNEAI